MLLFLSAPALAATLSLAGSGGLLDGAFFQTPANITFGGRVSDMEPGHSYRIRAFLPDGSVVVTTPRAGGAWSIPGPVNLLNVSSQPMYTASAQLFDLTAGRIVDVEVTTLVDLQAFRATEDDRMAWDADGFRYHVTGVGLEDYGPLVVEAMSASGVGLDERLADAIPPGSEVSADDGDECEPAAGMSSEEWGVLWDAAHAVLELVFAACPPALVALEAIDTVAGSVTVCFGGVYPVIRGVTTSRSDFELGPRDGGVAAAVHLGRIEADLELTTSIDLAMDLSAMEVELFGVGVSASDFGIDLAAIEVSLTDLEVCDARYWTGAGSGADLGFDVATVGTEPPGFVFRDDGAGTLSFDSPDIEANGACGWGIFRGRLERSMDNVEDEVGRAFEAALGVGDGEGSFAAVAIGEVFADMDTTYDADIGVDLWLAGVEGALDDDGIGYDTTGLTWQGYSRADGPLLEFPTYHRQDHDFSGLDAYLPDGSPYDLGVSVSAAALNQALAAGADSERMTYTWTPSWNDLGMCAVAPRGTDCDTAAVLDSTIMGRFHRGFRGMGTTVLGVRFVPHMAPFTAVEVDPVGEARGFWFVAGYRMQMFDVATDDVLVEVTMAASTDQFGLSLDNADAQYAFTGPTTPTYMLTHWGLGAWPTGFDATASLAPFVGGMLGQAMSPLDAVLAPEPLTPCGGGACVVGPLRSSAGNGVFYAWSDLD